MQTSVTQEHVYIDPEDAGIARVLANHFKAPKLKVGYRLPLVYPIMRELITVIPELRTNETIVNAGKKLRTEFDELRALRAKVPPIVQTGWTPLRDYQRQDVDYLVHLEAAAVFNDPRTGKTPTIIEVLRRKGLSRSLIVCPASLVYNWQHEFKKFWRDVPTKVVVGTPLQRAGAYEFDGIRIVSKDTLKLDLGLIASKTFDAIAVDEAHFLRNYDTAQSKAVCKVKAKHRYALTGTPVINNGDDMYGILHFLYPKMFTSYWQFVDLFFDVTTEIVNAAGTEVKKPGKLLKHREDAFLQMIALWSVQRKRKDVMPWLPPKQRTLIQVEMGEKQRKAYNKMVKEFNYKDEHGNEVDAQNAIVQLGRLRQLCQDPAIVGIDAPSAKTEALLEYIENNPEPLVVMTWHTSHLKQLLGKIKGRKVGTIHGEMSATEKAKNAEEFQMGRIDLLLCNTVSAGTGFTLDTGNTVVFLDKPWTPAELEQAEDRVCPTQKGKDLKHNIVTIVCKDSIDQKIDFILSQKMDATKMIMNGGAHIIRELLSNENHDQWQPAW